MRAEIHQLKPKPVAINWMCSACGIDAGCNCGAPLMSKAQRAAEAIKASPQKSDRAIADEIGVGKDTVRRAREAAGASAPVESRVGLDGKERRMPVRHEPEDDSVDFDEEATPSQKRDAFLIFSNEAMLSAKYDGPIDQSVLESAKATASAWCRLVETMEQGE